MTKLRVHEIAKELDKSNKEVMEVLGKNGIEVNGKTYDKLNFEYRK
jgi:hypothetical protein